MTRGTARAKVTLRGLPGRAWVEGTFESPGAPTRRPPPAKTDGDGVATLETRISATTSLTFTITRVSADRAGKRPLTVTGDPVKTIEVAAPEPPPPPKRVPARVKVFFGGKVRKGLPPKSKGVLYVRVEDARRRPLTGARIVAKYRQVAPGGKPIDRDWKKPPSPDARDCPAGTYAVRLRHATYQFRLVAIEVDGAEYRLENPESAWVCAAPRRFVSYPGSGERLHTNHWNAKLDLEPA